jgi:hypothetical protein
MVKVVEVAHSPAEGVKVYVVVAVLFRAGAQVPEMPFREVVGNGESEAPEQIAATGLNVGVIFGLTVMVRVVDVAHCPAVGVNVYVVVAVLFRAGVQVPEMPFREVVGNGESEAPEQIAATGLNVGVILGLTVMVRVVDVAHCPAVGVNVYVVVAVLFRAGDQVPEIPFNDVVGSGESKPPEQISETGLNVGVIELGLIVIVNVAVVAH